jgi:hypothetical protein
VLVSAYEQPADRLQVHVTSDVNQVRTPTARMRILPTQRWGGGLAQALSGALYTRLWSWTGAALAEWKTSFTLTPLASRSVSSYVEQQRTQQGPSAL